MMQEEHDTNVVNFLNRCIDADLYLNSDKCKSVPFLGKKLMAEGLKPNPNK